MQGTLHGVQNMFKITKADARRAAAVLARAFQDYPFASTIEPDGAFRRAKGPAMYQFFVDEGVRYGEVYAPSSGLEGVSIWIHSDKTFLTTWQTVVCGGLRLYRTFGREWMARLDKSMRFIYDLHKQLVPGPHVHLSFIGVEPDSQGRGLGTKMLTAKLADLDRSGLACYLENHDAKNVPLYRRLGFETIAESEDPELGIPMWSMLRQPRKAIRTP